jgi:electron-transferring-flavoprotein dehydrogenase
MSVERESIEFDVLFVGGGPANLAGAIRLMQLASQGKGRRILLFDPKWTLPHPFYSQLLA